VSLELEYLRQPSAAFPAGGGDGSVQWLRAADARETIVRARPRHGTSGNHSPGLRLATGMARHAPIFQARAKTAGITLRPDVKLPWLTRNGHLQPEVQKRIAAETCTALDRILAALGGDRDALASKTRGSMRADFLLEPQGVVVVEYDEVQHFTSARLETLAHYPSNTRLAFDADAYAALVKRWTARGDRGFAHKEAAEFPGPSGRMRQRAYFDALRDLVAPHFGNGPLIRVPAPDNDYDAAVTGLREQIAAL